MSACRYSAWPWPVAAGSVEMKPLVVLCSVGVEEQKLSQRRNQRKTEVGWSERCRISAAHFRLHYSAAITSNTTIDQSRKRESFFSYFDKNFIQKEESKLDRLAKMAHNAFGKKLFRSGSGFQQTINPLVQRRCQSTKGTLTTLSKYMTQIN